MNKYRLSLLAMFFFAASVNAQIRPIILAEEDAKTPESHQIVWTAEPGARYEVQRSINLLNWEVMQSFPAGATGLVQRMLFTPESRTLFFRIRQIDEQAPAITARIPEGGGFAVRRSADLSIGLTDSTGVDPASIRLAVGSLGIFTATSKQLTYTNGVLTFNSGGGTLGAYGETVPVSLIAADTLGNRATNAWSFKLEVEPQVVTNLFVFGSPQAQLMGQRIGGGTLQTMAVGANRWTLESVQLDRLVIAYTGATPPAIASGAYLCNLTPTKVDEIFYRKVTSLSNDSAKLRLTLMTVDVPLEEMIKQGSVSLSRESTMLSVGADGAIRRVASFDGQVGFSPLGFSLDGVEFKLKTSGGLDLLNLVAKELHWWLTPTIRASLDIGLDGLRRFEGIVRGDLDTAMILDVDVLLLGGRSETTLFDLPAKLEPNVWVQIGVIGVVPVYAQIKFDLKLLAAAEARSDLNFRFGFRQRAAAEFGIRYDRPEVTFVRDIRFAPVQIEPFKADITGELSLKLSLEPSVSFLIYGLAGAETSLALSGGIVFEAGLNKPLTGRLEADVSLDLAPSGPALAWLKPKPTLSKKLWEDHWHLFPEEPLLAFVKQPADMTAQVGDSIRLSASVNRTQDISFQWYHNGVPLPFEARSDLNLLNINPYHAGDYFVRAHSGRETLDSKIATLTVRSIALGLAPDAAPPGMVRIPAGTFTMGSPATEKERFDNETQHTVTISHDFHMSKYEVTQKEYLAVMGINPSYFTTKDYLGRAITPDLNRAVENVTWNDATNYCARVTASERAAGRLAAGWVYRLPTEAEWEYACRGGTTTVFYYGNDLRSGMANFDGRFEYAGGTGAVINTNGIYLSRTTAVGSYAPNGFGLYDMHGNVWEWCLDWFGAYPVGSVTDPKGPPSGSYRVIRGGCWFNFARGCRSAFRDFSNPDYGYLGIGFRPVLAPGQ